MSPSLQDKNNHHHKESKKTRGRRNCACWSLLWRIYYTCSSAFKPSTHISPLLFYSRTNENIFKSSTLGELCIFTTRISASTDRSVQGKTFQSQRQLKLDNDVILCGTVVLMFLFFFYFYFYFFKFLVEIGQLCWAATSGTPNQRRSVRGKTTRERGERMRRETRREGQNRRKKGNTKGGRERWTGETKKKRTYCYQMQKHNL